MKKFIIIFISLLIFASCGKDDSWSPEDDLNDYLTKNPYGVEFENGTDANLFVKCDALSSNIIIVEPAGVSDAYHCSNPGITIKYSGESTYWTEKTKFVELSKDKITRVTITYP